MKATASLSVAAVFAFLTGSVALANSPAPIRHLVYRFTYGTTSDLEIQSSGIGTSGSGIADDRGGTSDQGTITVDVMREDASKGLVVKISEQAQGSRSAKPATCVVYGTTATVCDPNAIVRSEEIAVLRLLGSNFVDPAKIDSKQQWSVEASSGKFDNKSKFTLAKNDAGLMTITEQRSNTEQIGGRNTSATTSATIGYDYPKQVMTSLNQFTQSREPRGQNQYMTSTTQITAKLQSDSMNKVAGN